MKLTPYCTMRRNTACAAGKTPFATVIANFLLVPIHYRTGIRAGRGEIAQP